MPFTKHYMLSHPHPHSQNRHRACLSLDALLYNKGYYFTCIFAYSHNLAACCWCVISDEIGKHLRAIGHTTHTYQHLN